MNRAFIVDNFKEFDDNENTIVAWATKETVDRDNEVLKANGWDLAKYRKNPVLMAFHDYKSFPVGKVLWVKPDPTESPIGLKFKAKFANTDAGKEAYMLYKDGIMNAFSVGFQPLEAPVVNEKGKPSKIFPKNELLEISCVPIPANPDALIDAAHSGLIKTKEFMEAISEFESIEMKPEGSGWDETDSSFRYRVRNPAQFQEGSFRTVPLKKTGKKINSVMGRLKNEDTMKIQSLIFPKEDGWTSTEAKGWLVDHPDVKKDIIEIFETVYSMLYEIKMARDEMEANINILFPIQMKDGISAKELYEEYDDPCEHLTHELDLYKELQDLI